MRTFSRLVTAAAVVVGYVALLLAISAGASLREHNAYQEAPAQVAAFRAALDRGAVDELRAIDRWFVKYAASTSDAGASIAIGADAAEDGDLDLARRFVDGVEEEAEEDQRALDEELATSWSRAVPWLVIGSILAAAALVLRHRRRLANAETVDLVSRFVPKRPVWRRPVFMVITGIGYVLLVSGFFAVVASTRVSEMPWAARGFLIAGGVVALAIAYFVLRYSRPRSARGAVQALRAEWREPVLYLRGFGDDQDAAKVDRIGVLWTGMLTIHSREEQLIGALGAFGPVVAVGQPGEQLPHLGAARFYLPTDDWQSGVLQLMDQSQLIVLRLGEGEGVWWEVDQARDTQPPGKLVLLLPGGRADLAERLDAHLPKPASVRPYIIENGRWTCAVIVFDRDWTPQVHEVGPFPGEKNRYGAPVFYVARAMQAALESVGTNKRAMGVRTNSRMLAAYGKVLLLLPAFFLLMSLMRLIFRW